MSPNCCDAGGRDERRDQMKMWKADTMTVNVEEVEIPDNECGIFHEGNDPRADIQYEHSREAAVKSLRGLLNGYYSEALNEKRFCDRNVVEAKIRILQASLL
jgi:hypothetical protein